MHQGRNTAPQLPFRLYPADMCVLSRLQSCLTLCDPMNCSCQAPLSTGFSRQENWSGLPSPSLGVLHPGIEPASLMPPAPAGRFFTIAPPTACYDRASEVRQDYTWEALPADVVPFKTRSRQRNNTRDAGKHEAPSPAVPMARTAPWWQVSASLSLFGSQIHFSARYLKSTWSWYNQLLFLYPLNLKI